MKTLQSSSRGSGRGRGNSVGRARGRGDTRFASRFTDPRFQLSRGGQGGVRRGNARDATNQDPRFAKRLQEMQRLGSESDGDDDVESMEGEEEGSGESLGSADNSPPTDDEAVEVSENEAMQLDADVAAWSASDVEYVEPHRRLAIVNCSWDHIRSVDLYAVLSHALPLGGQLLNVAVYMSDFGKRMLEHERMYGPDLWEKKGKAEEASPRDINKPHVSEKKSKGSRMGNARDEDNGDDYGGEGYPTDDDPWEDDNVAMLQEEGEDGELFSEGKHRKYERDRMKYYYAIATFDSAETAETVYNQLDGMDIEASGVVLDLRYVDDSEVFENPVNKADRIPTNYQPLAAFKAAALSQTRFRISWDQEDVFRHRSLRDSFTGETPDDDLAAYVAPPDSSDEDEANDDGANIGVGSKKAKRGKDKIRIRRKYAALLEEIGGLPEDYEGSDSHESAAERGDDSDSDDNSLNRFSDVEMEESNGEDDEVREVEATLDLDAGTKAVRLQREARIKQLMSDASLGSKAELKYKLRRSEMRKKKKEMFIQERQAEEEKLQSEREERRNALRTALGTDDEGATRLSGKEKRKQHARVVKQRLAVERVEKKKMRASNALGVTREARQHVAADTAVESIDTRFQSKLLSDPRFHLDVSQKDRRLNPDVVGLAATVATARQLKRQHNKSEKDNNGAVDYFLSRQGKKARKE